MLLENNKIHVELDAAIILHRRAYRETSLLLELLTQTHGRIALIAKGARKSKGRAGLLQPFQLLLCSWKSKTDLGILTQVELATSHNYLPLNESVLGNTFLNNSIWQPKLEGSVLYCGLYLNELIMRCIQRGQENETLLDLYRYSISKLQQKFSEAAVLREFEWKLISLLGYGTSLTEDSNNQRIDRQAFYFYQPEMGLTHLAHDSPQAISGKSLLELAENNWHNDSILKDARKLTHQALAPLVGTKPFASRSLYLGLKRHTKIRKAGEL